MTKTNSSSTDGAVQNSVMMSLLYCSVFGALITMVNEAGHQLQLRVGQGQIYLKKLLLPDLDYFYYQINVSNLLCKNTETEI